MYGENILQTSLYSQRHFIFNYDYLNKKGQVLMNNSRHFDVCIFQIQINNLLSETNTEQKLKKTSTVKIRQLIQIVLFKLF